MCKLISRSAVPLVFVEATKINGTGRFCQAMSERACSSVLKLLQSVLNSHGGSVAPAVHYLVAVLGDAGEIPLSEDIGGLPQAVPDEQILEPESPCPSPANSVVVELEGCHLETSELPLFEQSDHINCDPSTESLPSYSDVSGCQSPPPPSYDSLSVSGVTGTSLVQSSHCEAHSSEDEITSHSSGLRPVDTLARKIRIRRRQRKGYHPHKAEPKS